MVVFWTAVLVCTSLVLGLHGSSTLTVGNQTLTFPTANNYNSPQWNSFETHSLFVFTKDAASCDVEFYRSLAQRNESQLVIMTSSAACRIEDKLRAIYEAQLPIAAFIYHREIAAEISRPPGRGYRESMNLADVALDYPLLLMAYYDFQTVVQILNTTSDDELLTLTLSPDPNEWLAFFQGGLFLFFIVLFTAAYGLTCLAALYKLLTFVVYAVNTRKHRYNESFFLMVLIAIACVLGLLAVIDMYGFNGVFNFAGLLAINTLTLMVVSVCNFLVAMLWIQVALGTTELPSLKKRLIALGRIKWPFVGLISALFAVIFALIIVNDRVLVFTPKSATAYFYSTNALAVAMSLTLIIVGSRLHKIRDDMNKRLGKNMQGFERRILFTSLVSAIPIIVLFLVEMGFYAFRISDNIKLGIVIVIVRNVLLLLPLTTQVACFHPVRKNYEGIDSKRVFCCGMCLSIKAIKHSSGATPTHSGSNGHNAQRTPSSQQLTKESGNSLTRQSSAIMSQPQQQDTGDSADETSIQLADKV